MAPVDALGALGAAAPYAVATVALALLAYGARRPVLLRIGLRNVARRRAPVAIAVAGLLVATSIVSGSFIVGDSFEASIRHVVIAVLDEVDEVAHLPGDSPYPFFNASAFAALDAARASLPHVDGLAPRIEVRAPLQDLRSQLFRPAALVVGFDAAHDLGLFYPRDGGASTGAELRPGEAFLNAQLAADLEAAPGDTLLLFLGPTPTPITLRDLVEDRGRGAWGREGERALFLPLATLQAALGRPGEINEIVVSNVGGADEGYLRTDEAVAEVRAALPPGLPLAVEATKREAIDQTRRLADELARLFTLMGTFTVVAGLMLIVNIFAMLAEERKPEMGIARALGLQRRHLTFTFVAEGLVYALASAALGTVAGFGVAYAILWAFGEIFRFTGVRFVFAASPGSLLLAFSLGFLLTMATVALAAARVARLNIVRAIRDLPEPQPRRSTGRQVALGATMAAAGGGVGLAGDLLASQLYLLAGPCLLALGLAVLTMRRLSPRAAFTGAGAFMLAWLLAPLPHPGGVGIEVFIALGLLLVLAGVVLLTFNGPLILRAADRVAAARPRLLPVVRTAIAYPTRKGFRTGMTLAIFALVFFTITVMGYVMAMVAGSVDLQALQQSGGYDLLAVAGPTLPAGALDERNLTALGFLGPHPRIADVLGLPRARGLVEAPRLGRPLGVDLYGVDARFAAATGLTFYARDPAYPSDAAAWAAVAADPTLAVVDRSFQPFEFGPPDPLVRAGVGDLLEVASPLPGVANRTFRVVGVLDEFLLGGLFVHAPTLAAFAGADRPLVFYVKAAAGEDPGALGRDLERAYLPYGLVTLPIRRLVEEQLAVTLAVLQLLQAFLALGLLVGIAGLGIIALRNVVERRSETGALRALGFQRSMVLGAFLFEMSFIILLGLALGVLLGSAVAYDIHGEFFARQAPFAVPGANLALLGLLAYGASLLATLSPARRAARLPPAEALRRVD